METLDLSQVGDSAPSGEADLVASLLSISKSVRALMGVRLAELGLHPGQDELLLVLKDGTPKVVSRIAERLNVRPSTVSKMKDRLQDRQLLAASAAIDAADARNIWVQLTPAGLELAARVELLHQGFQDELKEAANGRTKAIDKAMMQIEKVLTQRLRRLR